MLKALLKGMADRIGRSLMFLWGGFCLIVSVALRVLPELFEMPLLSGVPYALTSIFWAAGFCLWLFDFWPVLSKLNNHPDAIP